jgi:hypothetical protein
MTNFGFSAFAMIYAFNHPSFILLALLPLILLGFFVAQGSSLE